MNKSTVGTLAPAGQPDAFSGECCVEVSQVFDRPDRALHRRPDQPGEWQRTFKVVKLLPPEGDEHQYRIKSTGEAFERVAKESQLDRFRYALRLAI